MSGSIDVAAKGGIGGVLEKSAPDMRRVLHQKSAILEKLEQRSKSRGRRREGRS